MRIVKTEHVNENSFLPFCHAATIVENKNSLFCAWFAGDYEGHRDCNIWISRKEGNQWSDAIKVAKITQIDNRRLPCWNPVLFALDNGTLLLFYKIGLMPSWWRAVVMYSQNGLDWFETLLPPGFYGATKNKPIQLADGKILCGSSDERKYWSIHLESSCDQGKTWTRTSPLHDNSLSLIQPTLLQFPSGKLQILCRSSQKYIFASDSYDNGNLWTPFRQTNVPNPNSAIDATTLKDGRALLVYNHSFKNRFPLNIAISNDEGKSWTPQLEIEKDCNTKEGYSYPSVIQANDNSIHVVYSWKCQKIKHAVIKAE